MSEKQLLLSLNSFKDFLLTAKEGVMTFNEDGEMRDIITGASVAAHFVRSTLLETASTDSWVGDLLNVFWKAGSFCTGLQALRLIPY